MPDSDSAVAKLIKSGEEAYLNVWSFILYSFPGDGKTTLAAQAPRPLILELDRNGWTVLKKDIARPKSNKFVVLRSFKGLVNYVRALAKEPEILSQFDTIVLDTISETQTLERLSQLPGDALTSPWPFNQHLYTVNNFRILLLAKEILELGKNTIFCCHLKKDIVGNESNKTVHIGPDLSEGLLTDLEALVDGTFLLVKTGMNTRQLKLQTGKEERTKSRFSRNATIQDPTFEKLLPVLEEFKLKKAENNE